MSHQSRWLEHIRLFYVRGKCARGDNTLRFDAKVQFHASDLRETWVKVPLMLKGAYRLFQQDSDKTHSVCVLAAWLYIRRVQVLD